MQMAKNNLKAATKKSIYESNVKKLDALGKPLGDFIKEESFSVIEGVVGDFILRVQENINSEKDMVTTGGIAKIDIKAENGAVNVYANKWLLYQDRGVNGSKKKLYNTPHAYSDKMPPVQVFKDWIKRKNINLVNNEKYDRVEGASPFKELTEEQQINKAAWGMATKVFQEGFRPRNILSKEYPQLIEDLTKQVANFCVQAVVQNIDVKESAKRIIK